MKIHALKALEEAFQDAKRRFVYQPLARSAKLDRYRTVPFDIVVKTFSDHRMAFDPNDFMGRTLMDQGHWQRDDLDWVVERLGSGPRGRVFLDVGAHVGTQSVYALIGGAFDRAIAIEPMTDNIETIRLNALLNDLPITVVPSAAGAEAGRLPFNPDPQNSGGGSLHHSLRGQRGADIEVEVERVDTILDRLAVEPAEIGLVWIDVEGFERQVLAGMPALLEARVPLFIEVLDHLYSPDDFAALKRLLGNYRFAVTRDGSTALQTVRHFSGDILFL